jgi:hypothetical protein
LNLKVIVKLISNIFTTLLIICAVAPSELFAADAATIIFRSGQRVLIDDGYRAIVEAMKDLNSKSQDHKVVELTIGGGGFLLNVAEVVIVCRDSCGSLQVVDTRDPARGNR